MYVNDHTHGSGRGSAEVRYCCRYNSSLLIASASRPAFLCFFPLGTIPPQIRDSGCANESMRSTRHDPYYRSRVSIL